MRRRRRADRARPAPATRVLLEPDDVPVGLTLVEVQSVMGDLFDSVADGTRGVYQKHLAYFGRWCQGRGIRQSLVETDHIKVYVKEALLHHNQSLTK